MRYAIHADEVFTPEPLQNAVILVEDGKIAGFGPRANVETPPDARIVNVKDAVVAPGFVDLHIHGAVGYDTMQADEDGLRRMAKFLAQKGVTSFVPTTVTASRENTLRAVKSLGASVRRGLAADDALAQPIGIHLEGPFLSESKRGVHPPEFLETPSLEYLEQICEASSETVKLITVAPELSEAQKFIGTAVAKGIRISIGHSNATKREACAAVAAGASHATHTFNAMRQLDHREPGILGVVLAEAIFADMIVDGVHVDEEVVRVFLAAKGEDLAVLITDALSATGMPDGNYKLGPFDVEVKGTRAESGGRLAGSVLTLDLAVRNVVSMAKWPLWKAVKLASRNPANVLGLTNKGRIEVGADADLVVLSSSGQVQKTVIAGKW